jgi:hypothetical protein
VVVQTFECVVILGFSFQNVGQPTNAALSATQSNLLKAT